MAGRWRLVQGVLGRRGPFFGMAETFRPDLSTSGRDEKFSAILRLQQLPHVHTHTRISRRIASPHTAAHCGSAAQDSTREHATLATRSVHNTHHCATHHTAPQHSAAPSVHATGQQSTAASRMARPTHALHSSSSRAEHTTQRTHCLHRIPHPPQNLNGRDTRPCLVRGAPVRPRPCPF